MPFQHLGGPDNVPIFMGERDPSDPSKWVRYVKEGGGVVHRRPWVCCKGSAWVIFGNMPPGVSLFRPTAHVPCEARILTRELARVLMPHLLPDECAKPRVSLPKDHHYNSRFAAWEVRYKAAALRLGLDPPRHVMTIALFKMGTRR